MWENFKAKLKELRLSPQYDLAKVQRETDALYSLLYNLTHDLSNAPDLSAWQTQAAFAKQWSELPQGQYLLSDSWFRTNVDRILAEEEIQLKREWFKGKSVLDAGCGNGRWSYGLAKLGAKITAVDVNQSAVNETRIALEEFDVEKHFYVSPLESLSNILPTEQYDLVFCWGVLHHCRSFNQSLQELCHLVKDDGVLYLYLYGRDSLSYKDDIELFKERIRFNTLPTDKDKWNFLLDKASGDLNIVHNLHDIYAPLINRRLEWDQVKKILELQGFQDIYRTIDHSELFIRAIKSDVNGEYLQWILPASKPPYWFQHHETCP